MIRGKTGLRYFGLNRELEINLCGHYQQKAGKKMNWVRIVSFFDTYGSTFDGIASIMGIVGGIFGVSGWLIARVTRKKNKEKLNELEGVIHSIKAENAQIAKEIHNYGCSYRDTKDIAGDVFDEKAQNMPRQYFQDNAPEDAEVGDIWI